MSTQQTTALALKLLAIWLLVQLCLSLPTLVNYVAVFGDLETQKLPIGLYYSALFGLFPIGFLAVFFIYRAATSVLSAPTTQSDTVLGEDSQKFLLQLGGFYFIVDALAYFPQSLYFNPYQELSIRDLLAPIGLGFQLLVGLALISKASFWMWVFKVLRGRS